MKRTIFALAATLATTELAQAATYFDSDGAEVPGLVLLTGCSVNGKCAGPAAGGSPMPVADAALIVALRGDADFHGTTQRSDKDVRVRSRHLFGGESFGQGL